MDNQAASEYQRKYNEYAGLIESRLKYYLSFYYKNKNVISEAMEYSLMAGGKRLRPVLSIAAAELLGIALEKVLPYACALEMIHTYSLIHDDLPAMDDDDLRRGKPTNHVVYGEAMAILAGDGLLNLAFEVMTDALLSADDEAGLRQGLNAMKYIAHSAGADGMILGQAIDLKSENIAVSAENINYMHDKKTGALIKAAVLAPALIVGANKNTIKALEAFASSFGLAFQIKDDILDVEGDAAILGKSTGKDAESGKNTFVAAYGLEQSHSILEEETDKAICAAEALGENAGFFIWLTRLMSERSR